MAVVVAEPRPLLTQRLQEMPGLMQLLQLVVLAAAIAAGIWLFFWTQSPSQIPLFTGLADRDAGEVVEALRAAQIPYTLDRNSGAILVPEEQVHEARLKLAAQGLPNGARAGFEMIQGEQGFGVSQFVEGARYQLAMETELSRTIASLRTVKDARVHLAVPKPTAFTRGRESASASVMVDLYSGRALDSNQVAAIVHLVSSSVPNLAPDRVTVVDQTGRMLTIPDPNSEAAMSARQFDQVRRMEQAYMERLIQLLEPLTGPGRVSAQVNVEMDFAVVEEAREVYTPDPAKLRSEQTSEQTAASMQAGAAPGATPNTPLGIDAGGGAAEGGPSSASRSATRNFELDRTLTHTRTAPGRLSRVSAAVLIDNLPAGVDEAGNVQLRAMTEAELERVQALVREAIGFSAERGDSVSVMNAPFVQPAPMEAPEAPPLWLQAWENPQLFNILRILAGVVILLVLFRTILRPTVNRILAGPTPPEPPKAAGDEDEDDELLLDADGEPRRLSRQNGDHAQLPPPTPGEEAQGILAGPAGFEQRMMVARAAVAQDPRRVAQVVRGWVNADG